MRPVFLLSLFFLTCLTSCGSQQGGVKIEVTKAFQMVNSTYGGGLYIYGHSTSGDKFSLPISSGTTATVNLKFGTWNIVALAWDNTSDKALEGTILCGSSQVQFSQDEQSVQIQVANTNCPSVFSSSKNLYTSQDTAYPHFFSSIGILPCGKLPDPSSTVRPDFCRSFSMEFQRKPVAMKYSLEAFSSDGTQIGTDVFESHCIPIGELSETGPGQYAAALTPTTENLTNSGDYFFPNNEFNYPSSAPIKVTFYEDSTCSSAGIAGQYPFSKGLQDTSTASSSGFEALFYDPASDPSSGALTDKMLSIKWIPTKDPFKTELPILACGTSKDSPVPCLTLPPLPSGKDFIINPGGNRIYVKENIDCLNYDLTYSLDNTTYTIDLMCNQTPDGGTILDLNLDYTFVNLPTNITLTFSPVSGSNLPNFSYTALVTEDMYDYQFLSEVLGFKKNSSTSPDIRDSLIGHDDKDDESEVRTQNQDKPSRLFSEISKDLSSLLLGGLLWDQQCSSTSLTSEAIRYVSFWEPNKTDYKIIFKQSEQEIPDFIKTNISSQTTKFDRFIAVQRENTTGDYETFVTYDISCDNTDLISFALNTNNLRIGRMERQESGQENNVTYTRKELIYWNTTLFSNSRSETYRYQTFGDKIHTSFTRVEKHPTNTTSDNNSNVKITEMNYRSEQSNGEMLNFNEHHISGNNITIKSHTGFKIPSTNTVDIFGSLPPRELSKIRSNLHMNSQNNELDEEIKVASGGQFIHPKRVGSNLVIDWYNGNNYYFQTFSNTDTSFISSDISDNGGYVVVVTANQSGDLKIFTYNKQSNSWSLSKTTSLKDNNTIQKLKVAFNNDGQLVIAATTPDSELHFYKGTVSQISSEIDYIPSTITADAIHDFDLAKNDTNFLLMLKKINASNSTESLSFCEMSDPNYDCNLTDIDSEANSTSPYIFSFSGNLDSSGTFTVTYERRSSNSTGPQVDLMRYDSSSPSTNPSTIISEIEPLEQQIFTKNLNMTTITPNASQSGTSVNLLVPYKKPSVSDFHINYQSLEPYFMDNSVFTSATIYSGLTQQP